MSRVAITLAWTLLASGTLAAPKIPVHPYDPKQLPDNLRQSQPVPKIVQDDPSAFYLPVNFTAERGIDANALPAPYTFDIDPHANNWFGTALFGFEGCGLPGFNRAKIQDAYYDMYYLTNQLNVASDIDWNSAAALEYLGPPVNNKDSRETIQKYLNLASQTYSGHGLYSHWIHARCDDPKKACTGTCDRDGNPRQVTVAWSSQNDGNGYAQINFCPRFFELPRLRNAAIDSGKALQYPEDHNLINYENTARVFLHELLHLDYFIGTAPGEHVTDLNINLYGRAEQDRLAYGPLITKTLARYQQITRRAPPAGYYVQRNADNMALFALAMYVQRQLGDVYPHLPLVLLRPFGAPHIAYNANVTMFAADGEFQIADDPTPDAQQPCSTDIDSGPSPEVLVLDEFAPDSAYPAAYVLDHGRWAKEQEISN